MKPIYLKEFSDFAKKKVAYIPVGTIEWHGNYLPIETDFLIAQKICEKLASDFSGYILPPIYLGGYGSDVIDGVEMRGMDRKLKKKLPGNIYFLKPELLTQILNTLVQNLIDQGFEKIIIVTGHGGEGQTIALNEVAKNENVLFVDPYEPVDVHHADEGEISLLWACYPEEESQSRSKPSDSDLAGYYGYDPITKSSVELGGELQNKMLDASRKKIYDFINK